VAAVLDLVAAMERLGYVGQLVSLNSMFALPTPQSRDRIYIVWTKGRQWKPDLAISPVAPCIKCGDVEALQTWRTGRAVGKYGLRNQYWYTCPKCRALVTPYYYCALNAIDFSIPATRIGDRDEPLKPKTLARVRYGSSGTASGRCRSRPTTSAASLAASAASTIRSSRRPVRSPRRSSARGW
jgi:hypothetical protein